MQVNHAKLGFDITAFLGVYLEKSRMYEKVAEELAEIDDLPKYANVRPVPAYIETL